MEPRREVLSGSVDDCRESFTAAKFEVAKSFQGADGTEDGISPATGPSSADERGRAAV